MRFISARDRGTCVNRVIVGIPWCIAAARNPVSMRRQLQRAKCSSSAKASKERDADPFCIDFAGRPARFERKETLRALALQLRSMCGSPAMPARRFLLTTLTCLLRLRCSFQRVLSLRRYARGNLNNYRRPDNSRRAFYNSMANELLLSAGTSRSVRKSF